MNKSFPPICLLPFSSLLLFILFAACSTTPTPTVPTIPTNSPSPLPLFTSSPSPTFTSTPPPTNTYTPEPTSTPKPTQIPLNSLEPFVTALVLRLDSWSPDRQWIAYWQSAEDFEISATLTFANILTGDICEHVEVPGKIANFGYLLWQEDGSVVAFLTEEEKAMRGQPCETFTEFNDFSPPEWGVDVSPDGRFRAQYTILSWGEGGFRHSQTTITDLTTGETIVSLEWDTGYFGHRAGPNWLNNELFLIGKDYDQGWIYASMPEGHIGNVFPDLFGLDVQLEEQVEILISQSDASTGEYHLMAVGGLMPSILLYHSELDWVEEIPFKGISSFTMYASSMGISPDGKWMLLSIPVGEESSSGQFGQDAWLRPLDPPGSEPIPLPKHPGGNLLSPDFQKMALFGTNSILITSFPDVQDLSRWETTGYYLTFGIWSPDGKWLAVSASHMSYGKSAVFVFMP